MRVEVETHGENVAEASAKKFVGEPGDPIAKGQAQKEDLLPLVSDSHFGEAGTVVRG